MEHLPRKLQQCLAVSLLSLATASLITSCGSNTPTAKTTPSVSPVASASPQPSECELAAQDKTLSTVAALQKCLDHYRTIGTFPFTLIMIPEDRQIQDLGNNRYAVSLKFKDLLRSTQINRGLDSPNVLQGILNDQIRMSMDSFVIRVAELLELFGKRGLTQVDAALYTDGGAYGIEDAQGRVQPQLESYRVLAKPTDLAKIKAWQKKDTSVGNVAEDPDLNAMWTVKVNRYPGYRLGK